MLTQKTKDDWQKAFEKQMDIAEKPNIAKVKRYYKKEYNKAGCYINRAINCNLINCKSKIN